jgi:long-chain fatty acid transport protein
MKMPLSTNFRLVYLNMMLSILFLVSHSASYNSIFSTRGLGLELSSSNVREAAMGHAGMASISGLGSSIKNPSKTGFNTRTTFEAAFQSDLVYVEDAATSNTLSSSRIPFIGLNFQAGMFGNLGLHYFQRFEKNFAYQSFQGSHPYSEPVRYEAGAYEIILSLARQFYGHYAVGLSYHLLWGRDRNIREVHFNGEEFEQELLNLQGDTTLTRWSGGYPALSLTYSNKTFSCAAKATLPMKLEGKTERRLYNQFSGPAIKKTYDFPVTFGLGVSYRFSRKNTMVLDASITEWDKNIDKAVERSYKAGIGYEFKGLGVQYDPYYKKIAYRTGIGYEKMYLWDANIYSFTAGLGLPLGKRGSTMDIAMELGRRGSLELQKVRENYLRIYISLIGAGIWGRPSRSR